MALPVYNILYHDDVYCVGKYTMGVQSSDYNFYMN